MVESLKQEYKLSDLCEIKYGKDYKKINHGNVPLYGSGGLMGHVDNFLYAGSSVLIPRKGTLSNLFFVEGKFWTVDTLFWTKINEEIVEPRYLYYVLKNTDLESMNVGSAVPSLTTKELNQLILEIPELTYQKRVSNFLSSLDDKIEINNKINSNLEELAQTLYKRWFVDFEFPNEEGKPYKSSGGEMVESELGLIPKGWEVKTIHSIVKTSLGGTPSRNKPDYWDGEVNWIKSGELNNLRITKPTQKISEIGLNSSAAKVMPIGTILIGITGYVGVVSMLEIDCAANQSVVGLIPNNEYPRSYLYGLVKTVSPEISLKQTGSAQQHINKNDIDTHKIVVPDNLAIIRFSNIAEPLHLSISNNLSQNDSLTITRDLLLPKLMSGEIEV